MISNNNNDKAQLRLIIILAVKTTDRFTFVCFTLTFLHVSYHLHVKPPDVFRETLRQFPAVFVAGKTCI